MSNTLKVTKSNILIKASYHLSLNEERLLLFIISQINPMSLEFQLSHTINFEKYFNFWGLVNKSSFFTETKAAATSLFEREYGIKKEDGTFVRSRWIYEFSINEQTKEFTICFHPDVAEYLYHLERKFTTYRLESISKLTSSYSIRFYEIAILFLQASQKPVCFFTRSLASLKEQFDIEDKYRHFGNFKQRVVDYSMSEINLKTDINIEYETVKKEGVIHGLKFMVANKNKAAFEAKPTDLIQESFPESTIISRSPINHGDEAVKNALTSRANGEHINRPPTTRSKLRSIGHISADLMSQHAFVNGFLCKKNPNLIPAAKETIKKLEEEMAVSKRHEAPLSNIAKGIGKKFQSKYR